MTNEIHKRTGGWISLACFAAGLTLASLAVQTSARHTPMEELMLWHVPIVVLGALGLVFAWRGAGCSRPAWQLLAILAMALHLMLLFVWLMRITSAPFGW